MAKAPKSKLGVEALKHCDAKRKNIPTAEYQSVMRKEEREPTRIAYLRSPAVYESMLQRLNADPRMAIQEGIDSGPARRPTTFSPN